MNLTRFSQMSHRVNNWKVAKMRYWARAKSWYYMSSVVPRISYNEKHRTGACEWLSEFWKINSHHCCCVNISLTVDIIKQPSSCAYGWCNCVCNRETMLNSASFSSLKWPAASRPACITCRRWAMYTGYALLEIDYIILCKMAQNYAYHIILSITRIKPG